MMTKIEEILPKIRKGSKARRKVWPSGVFHISSYLSSYPGLTHEDILADDWELVPGQKHKAILCLWSDGIARFHGDMFTTNPGDHIVQVKEIEWEVEE